MKRQSNKKLWFIPIRIHTTPAARILEVKTVEEGIKILRKDELYYKTFNSLPNDKRGKIWDKSPKSIAGPDIFEMEDDFFEYWGDAADINSKRFPEEIPSCAYRKWNKKYGEYFCKGFDSKEVSYPNMFCIIHGEHFNFDLPQDCPYLKKESKYIQFTE